MLLFVVRGWLFVVCCLLLDLIGCGLLCVVCCLLVIVCCVLFGMCNVLLFVVCCVLLVWCSLFGVCYVVPRCSLSVVCSLCCCDLLFDV